MATMGARGRGKGGAKAKAGLAAHKAAGTAAGKGPGWKPAKASVSGNYGKAVSAAAKAKNAVRIGSTPTKTTPPSSPTAGAVSGQLAGRGAISRAPSSTTGLGGGMKPVGGFGGGRGRGNANRRA